MNVLFLQFLDTPCVRSRKIISELNRNGYDSCYWGNKRNDNDIGAKNIRHLGIPCKRFSKLKPIFIPVFVLHAVFSYIFIPKPRPRILYCADLEAGIVGAMLKVLIPNITFIYDVYDTYSIRYHKLPRIIRFFLFKLETLVANRSDLLIHVEKLRISTLATKESNKTIVVRNVPMKEDLPELSRHKQKYNQDKFTVLLSGGLFFHRGLKLIVNAVRELNIVSEDTIFEVVALGFGGKSEMDFIDKNSDIVRYLGSCSSASAQKWSCKADLIVSFYDPASPINRLACPNKVFDGLFNGTKIIMNSELDISEFYATEPGFYFSPYSDLEAVKQAIWDATQSGEESLIDRAMTYRRTMCWHKEFSPVIAFLKEN